PKTAPSRPRLARPFPRECVKSPAGCDDDSGGRADAGRTADRREPPVEPIRGIVFAPAIIAPGDTMRTDFLPGREADLVTWSANFAAKTTATPTAYGLTTTQASTY